MKRYFAVLLVLIAPSARALPLLDLLFPPPKWDQKCKDLAAQLANGHGISSSSGKDADYEKRFNELQVKREEYWNLLKSQWSWKNADQRREGLEEQVHLVQREIDGLEKETQRYKGKTDTRSQIKYDMAIAKIPALKGVWTAKRRELGRARNDLARAQATFNQSAQGKPLLAELIKLDTATVGHWAFERFADQRGGITVQEFKGRKSTFFIYTDKRGYLLGYRETVPGGGSLYVQLNDNCSPKARGFSGNPDGAGALYSDKLCARREDLAQIVRRYNVNSNDTQAASDLAKFLEESGSIVTSVEKFKFDDLNAACTKLYPETNGQVPYNDPAQAGS